MKQKFNCLSLKIWHDNAFNLIRNILQIKSGEKVLSNHTEQPILFAVGINHKTATIEAREKIYIGESEIPALIAELSASLTESVVLSTCNRTEIYGVTTRTDLDLDYYKDLLINFKIIFR